MKIACFTKESSAIEKLNKYNELAKSSSSSLDFSLATLNQNQTKDVYWFNFDDCVKHGGKGATAILADEKNLNILSFVDIQGMVDAKYLPSNK